MAKEVTVVDEAADMINKVVKVIKPDKNRIVYFIINKSLNYENN